ncbi:MAG: hypothetical protein EOO04_16365 [Chitinophagaceae bacterium]|nr:MAG: hypothetical protein EOO04_16365 [Chitinophagaceae bacterium]
MQITLILAILLPLFIESISGSDTQGARKLPAQNNTLFEHVGDIPLPPGFNRVEADPRSFGSWLRNIRISSDNTVYLFDGTKKRNQQAQFAVLQVPVGKKNLQQCADAVMRLRAAYLLKFNRRSEIWFRDNAGKKYQCPASGDSANFERYLEKVYGFCGTSSLARQLKPVRDFTRLKSGDVLIKGGFPGHAVIVMDVAVNKSGQKIFMIAQSYMPAQSIHILKNPSLDVISPWYEVQSMSAINTPEWEFTSNQLMEW